MARTRTIPQPNAYIMAIYGEYKDWCFDEEQAPLMRGKWRSDAFRAPATSPLDLEIGTGNGLHFAHHAIQNPQRNLLGLELKYKPLIQSIRRARKAGMSNARIARYNAYLLPELFTPGEVDDVFIFFPDPWEKIRQHKHRLIQDEFLRGLHAIQRPGGRLFFKTDSQDYFKWALTRFERSPFEVVDATYDLHQSPFQATNFITQFERIFMRQGLKIGYACMRKA